MILWLCRTACLALFATAPLGSDHGANPVIAVVSPSQIDRAMLEALNRFRGEAAAVGFAVTIVPASKGAPSVQMESAARAVPGVATVAFVRGGDPTDLDVWFTDRLDGQTFVDHVSVETNRADRAVVLAVKAVDVLRARMFGLLARRGRPANGLRADGASALGGSVPTVSTPPTSPLPEVREARESDVSPPDATLVARPLPPKQEPARTGVVSVRSSPPEVTATAPTSDEGYKSRARLGVGVGTLRTFAALGNPMLLVVRGQYDITAKSVLRLTVGGIGSHPVTSASAGSVSVRDTFLLIEAGALPWGSRLQPVLAGGLGLHYFSSEGTAMPGQPYTGMAMGQLVGAGSVSVGLRARLSRHVGVSLDTAAQILFPRVQAQAAGANPQLAGRPALMATVALEGRL